MQHPLLCRFLSLFVAGLLVLEGRAEEKAFPTPPNSQAEDIPILTPDQALASIKVPPGFKVGLFAHEPQVQQPIAMTFDGRGRLWVAENYTYADRTLNFDLSLRDRILVLHDTDGDGQADERKVFWDRAQRLTSIEVGLGGIWALCSPQLLFIPDRNGDDIPDGEPEVVLDGWDDGPSRHNMVNGLKWGPDGWLYGRNGILATSHVGPPGASAEERVPINCGIWRYHPTRKTFEVVCTGTTNPWGHDWDEHGQLFFINTVIGHLWHALPGAHFRRMYGEGLNPYVYELIEQTADHFHWDTENEEWTALRTKPLSTATDRAGGGHAHAGLMIYQGDNWPSEYRGEVFALNLHGRRVNQDHLEPSGATYVGKHRPDLLTVGDPWFRGIDLTYGPDGSVYILDWSDIGECHETDGVHRTSGRIYKVTYAGNKQKPSKPAAPPIDLDKLPNGKLVELLRHDNEWFVRQARRVLRDRAVAGADLSDTREALLGVLHSDSPVQHRLRALWALHAIEGTSEGELLKLLDDPNEHLRVWGVNLLVDGGSPAAAAVPHLQTMAAKELSGLVLIYLASALQRLAPADRWAIAHSLVQHDEFATDRVFPLMVWYGLESAVPADPQQAVEVVSVCRLPQVARYVARRLTAEIEQSPQGAEGLVQLATKTDDTSLRRSILQGMNDALRGWLKAPQPAGWESLIAQIEKQASDETKQLARELSVVFGSGRAIEQLQSIAVDAKHPADTRRQAVRSLAGARVADVDKLLLKLVTDNDVAEEAARGLAMLNPPGMADTLLAAYGRLREAGRLTVVEVMATRPATAKRLLAAVEKGAVTRSHVQPFVLRQMQLLGDAEVQAKIEQLWPSLRLIPGEKLQRIADYQHQLSGDSLAVANAANGHKLFEQSCAKCHKLFGRGEAVGPELTGAQRSNLNYWLENIVDPSAQVATNFRMSILLLDDGRVLNGVVLQQTDRTLTLQTPTEKMVLDRRAVEEIRPSQLSLMPDGLLSQLNSEQIRDLFAYLMAPQDPAGKTAALPTSTTAP